MSLQTYFRNEEHHYVFDVQREEFQSLQQLLAIQAEPIIINVYSDSANFQCQDLDINNIKIKNNYN